MNNTDDNINHVNVGSIKNYSTLTKLLQSHFGDDDEFDITPDIYQEYLKNNTTSSFILYMKNLKKKRIN